MLHTKFQGHRPISSKNKDFKGFYFIWAWWPSWSFEWTFVPPSQKRIYMKCDFDWPSGFLDVWKCWRWQNQSDLGPRSENVDTCISSCVHLVYNTYQLLYHDCSSFWEIHYLSVILYESIRNQIWPLHKKVKSQAGVIISTQCCIPSFNYLGHSVLKKKSFDGFYHIWTWRPTWSCNQDHWTNFCSLIP